MDPDKDNKELLVRAYLTEYDVCAESFRHTYATIWQAAAIFGGFTVATQLGLALTTSLGRPIPMEIQSVRISSIIAIIVLAIWWIGIFEPMNYYGDVRAKRLQTIEEILNKEVLRLNMSHFVDYNQSRKGIYKFLRVRWGVRVFGSAMIIILLAIVVS